MKRVSEQSNSQNQRDDKMTSARQRAQDLSDRVDSSELAQDTLTLEAVQEFRTTLEELQVAHEELGVQNEELLAAREIIEAEKEKYWDLFEFAPDGYLVTDQHGKIIEANRPAAAMFGVDIPFLISKLLATFVPNPDLQNFRTSLNRLVYSTSTAPVNLELRFRPRGGPPFDASLTVAAIRSRPGDAITLRWIVRDITERKNAEREILALNATLEQRVRERTAELEAVSIEREALLANEQNLRAQAEDSNRIKDEFLAICSHELRAPLSAIQGWAEILTRGEIDAETSRRALETILRNVRAQTQIIKDLLDVSRVIAGKLRLSIGAVDLVPIIESTVESFRPSAEVKGVNLTVSLGEKIGPLLCDSIRVQQIVWNLLSNALKFTPKGGAVDIRIEPENDGAKITVTDTGVGIRPDFLPHVFDLFRQADSRTNRSYGGLGLGLAIVRNLTSMHGGTARAESAGLGKGSTFEVILPPEPPSFESGNEPETRLDFFGTDQQTIPEGSRPLEGARLLVIDDDPDSREMLNAALTAYGGEVRTCKSSAEALKTVQEWMPDLLVSDIGMPGDDGYTLIKHIRELPADRGGSIPALALTGYATLEDHHRALAAGYQMHLAKPAELRRLAVIVTRLLGRT